MQIRGVKHCSALLWMHDHCLCYKPLHAAGTRVQDRAILSFELSWKLFDHCLLPACCCCCCHDHGHLRPAEQPTETTQAQDNPDPTVMTGKWKTASTQGAVALLLVSMKRYKTAQIHLEAMAKTAQECILDNHWVGVGDWGDQLCRCPIFLCSPAGVYTAYVANTAAVLQ